MVRAYLRGESLPFKADGYGYDKRGVVLSEFLNYYVGEDISRNSGEGVEKVIADAAKVGIKLEFICYTLSGILYQFSKIAKKRRTRRPVTHASMGAR